MLLFALEKLTGQKVTDAPKIRPTVRNTPRLAQPRKRDKKQKIGRTIPAPVVAARSSRCAAEDTEIQGSPPPGVR